MNGMLGPGQFGVPPGTGARLPPSTPQSSHDASRNMMSPPGFSPDTAEKMLRSYIYDYLAKRGLGNAASALRSEIASRGQQLEPPPPLAPTPQPFLYEWFSFFWDKFEHRARREYDTAAKEEAQLADVATAPSLSTMNGPQTGDMNEILKAKVRQQQQRQQRQRRAHALRSTRSGQQQQMGVGDEQLSASGPFELGGPPFQNTNGSPNLQQVQLQHLQNQRRRRHPQHQQAMQPHPQSHTAQLQQQHLQQHQQNRLHSQGQQQQSGAPPFPYTSQPNPMMGFPGNGPPNHPSASMGMQNSFTIEGFNMFNNPTDGRKSSMTMAGMSQSPRGSNADVMSTHSAPPNVRTADRTPSRAASLNNINHRFKRRPSSSDLGHDNIPGTNENRGENFGLRRTSSDGTAPFDNSKGMNKRQRTNMFPPNFTTGPMASADLRMKVQEVMRDSDLPQQEGGLAKAKAAAAVAAQFGRGLPHHALPVQYSEEKGLIYFDGSGFRVWPGGQPMPTPTDPKEIAELKRIVMSATKARGAPMQNKVQNKMQPPQHGHSNAGPLMGVNMHAPSKDGANGVENERNRNNPQASSFQEAFNNVQKDMRLQGAAQTSSTKPQEGATLPNEFVDRGKVDGVVTMEKGIKASTLSKNEQDQNDGTRRNVETQGDDATSNKSGGQDSNDRSLSQRSSVSNDNGSSNAKRATVGTARSRGKGSRSRAKGKKEGESAGARTKESPRTTTKRGRKTGSRTKKGSKAGNETAANKMIGVDVQQSQRMNTAQDLEREQYNHNHQLLGNVGMWAQQGQDSNALDDGLQAMSDAHGGVTQGMGYDGDLHTLMGSDEHELGSLFGGLSSEFKNDFFDT